VSFAIGLAIQPVPSVSDFLAQKCSEEHKTLPVSLSEGSTTVSSYFTKQDFKVTRRMVTSDMLFPSTPNDNIILEDYKFACFPYVLVSSSFQIQQVLSFVTCNLLMVMVSIR